VRSTVDGHADCVYRPPVSATAVAEVRRHLRMPLKLTAVEPEVFDALLRHNYEAGSESMQAVEGLEETTDLAHLAQDLPEQADLLESNDDAPIIRLINAVLTQAIRENARTSTSNRSRTGWWCASVSMACYGSAAIQARGGLAGGLAHQSHVQA